MSSKFIPNSFQVPNAVVDELMDDLKDVEFRCYITLIRQTTGWNKQFDFISVSQFQKFTGRGKTAIVAAMRNLQNLGLVVELEQTKNGVKCYALNFEKLAEWGSESEPQVVQKVNGSKSEPVQKVNWGGSESEPQGVQKVNTQNTNIKTHSTKTTTTAAPVCEIVIEPETEIAEMVETVQPEIRQPEKNEFGRFEMFDGWQPEKLEIANRMTERAGVLIKNFFSTEFGKRALWNFIDYRMANHAGEKDTEDGWTYKLSQSAKRFYELNRKDFDLQGNLIVLAANDHSGSLKTDKKPSATAQKIALLEELKAARLAGENKGVMDVEVYAALCDCFALGLQACTSYAPLLDGIKPKLNAYEKQLAHIRANENGVARLKAAFGDLLVQASFPTVAEIMQRMINYPYVPQHAAQAAAQAVANFRQPETVKPKTEAEKIAEEVERNRVKKAPRGTAMTAMLAKKIGMPQAKTPKTTGETEPTAEQIAERERKKAEILEKAALAAQMKQM